MKILNVTRGSYREVIVGDVPYMQIDGFPKNAAGMLLTDFRTRFQEKNAIIQCFNEINHVYAFGHDPDNSTFSATFLVFLGRQCMTDNTFTPGPRVKEFVRTYLNQRVSQKKTTVKITWQSVTYVKGILLGFDFASYDEEMNMATVTFSGKFFMDAK